MPNLPASPSADGDAAQPNEAPAPNAGPDPVITRDQTVATVNGARLSGRDLLAFGTAPSHTLSPQMFAFLRQRAIDRTLILAEAQRRRIELSAEQTALLAEMRTAAIARGVSDPGELDFEQADARSDLLRAELLEQAGISASFGPAEIDAYRREHADDFPALPPEDPTDPTARAEAEQKIELQIRQLLSDQAQAAYQEKLDAYMTKLRSAASITTP